MTTLAEPQTLKVVRVVNPFDLKQLEQEQWEWHEGVTLADYFPVGCTPHAVSVNGGLVEPEAYALTGLRRDDVLVVCPIVQGGGGDDKAILRLVAMIAVALVAPALATALGAGTSGLAFNMAVMGINIAGSLLVNALLPPATPKDTSASSDPSYGIDQQKNTAEEGIPVPVYYGQSRVGGNVIGLYVENDGKTQYLYTLLNLGEGPIASAGIESLLINDQPASNFSDVEVQFRQGGASQALIPWFNDIVTPFSINQKLSDSSYVEYTTTGEVDKIRVDLLCPLGLTQSTNSGSAEVSVSVTVEYRLQGSSTWNAMGDSIIVGYQAPVYTYYGYVANAGDKNGATLVPGETTTTLRPGTSVSGDSIVVDMSEGSFQVVGYVTRAPIYASGITLKDNTTSAVRKSVFSPQLPEGIYEVRVKRLSPDSTDQKVSDDVYVSDINEIVTDDVSYVHTALLGIRIRLTDQLSGMPTFTVIHGGRMIANWSVGLQDWAPIAPTANPAWVLWDMLTNTRFGGGIPADRIDLEQFKAWAAFCDADPGNLLRFNGGFNEEMTLWDACQLVARAGHAQLVNIGTRWTVIIERAADPVQAFSVANMLKGSFKLGWAGTQDRANEIEVTFNDAAANYEEKTIRIYDPVALSLGRKSKTASIRLHGITNATRAAREGIMQLNMNRYVLQTCEFGVASESLGCTVGDVILVQHDMPQWGFSGRFEAGCTDTVLQLDREVTMQLGRDYRVLAVFDTVQRASGTVSAVTGKYVTLSGFTNSGRVRRLLINGTDREVLSVYSAGAGVYGVTLADASGIAVGNAYQLFDTDVIEERNVINTANTTSSITVTSAFSTAPAQLVKWLFGEVGKTSKPFRVKLIDTDTDLNAVVKAIEYNASVYNLSGYATATPNYSALTPYTQHVVIDGVTERLIKVNNAILTEVTVGFHSTQRSYKSADVYASIDGSAEQLVASGAFDRATLVANDGAVVVFRVVAKDSVGSIANRSTAPTISHTVAGRSAIPPDVASLSYEHEPFGVRFSWPAVQELDVAGYELRQGSTWASANPIAKVEGTTYFWTVQVSGSIPVLIKTYDSSGNLSANATAATVTVQNPSAAGLTGEFDGQNFVLSWTPASGSFVIDRYQIRTGSDWASGTPVGEAYSNTFTAKANWLGSKRFLVAGIDAAGNVGAPGTVDLTVTAPSLPSATAEVIDNNVLLRWLDSKTTLPIDRYEIRRGATWDGGSPIGDNGNGRFAVFFEQQAGNYTYWIKAFDTANNASAAASIAAIVNQPPDYLLKTEWNSTFDSASKSNVLVDEGALLAPVKTAETWEQHFTTNGWTTPQNQIDAGFPLYLQPGATSGYYEETIDYGSLLNYCQVIATLTFETLSGTVTITPTISVKKLSTDSWTDFAGANQVFANQFQFVKVRYDFTGTGGDDVVKVTGLNVKLAAKLRNDGGEVFANAADVDGTPVTLNIPFADITSITVTPKYTAAFPGARIAIYDFADDPNPTGFKVLLYNMSGTRVDGYVSWSVKGA